MKYRYWAAQEDGLPCLREVEAESPELAVRALTAQGLTVLALDQGERSISVIPRLIKKRFRVDLFAQELLALLQAGLTIVEALRALSEDRASHRDRLTHAVVEHLSHELETGQTFATALESRSEFPALFVAMVRASEQTSDLPSALQRYLDYAQQVSAVRERVISASIYPLLLIGAGFTVLVFLLIYVVPRFAGIYEGLHKDLPWAATVLMQWGLIVKHHGATLAVTALTFAALCTAALSSPVWRAVAFAQLLKWTRTAHLVRMFHVARYFRTCGMLLEGGIALPRATQMALAILPPALREQAQAALTKIEHGNRPSEAYATTSLSTPIVEQLLSVGERTGDLGAMMTRAAAFYEADGARTLERIMRALEPILMAAIGIAIGSIVVLMYLPIFELAGAIN